MLDYKEAFNFPSDFSTATDDQLPSVMRENRKRTELFTQACQSIGCQILRGLAAGLGLDPDYFVRGHNYRKVSGSAFRLLRYPAVPDSVDSATTTRAGSHSDYGSLTLLFQELPSGSDQELASGLQVFVDDAWHDVPAKKDCIVVNVADLLAFWTEGRVCSAVHRVTLPDDDSKRLPRYSMVFFMHPDDEHIIRPVPSPRPAPFPAKLAKDGSLVATFGPSPFVYHQSGREYLQHRLKSTYTPGS